MAFNYGTRAPLAEKPIMKAGEHAEAHLLVYDVVAVLPGFDAWASLQEEKAMARMVEFNHGVGWQDR